MTWSSPDSDASYILGLKVSMYENDRALQLNATNNLYHVPKLSKQPVLATHSQISLIEVLTLSITRLCFPS
jgi:hypothetical protein